MINFVIIILIVGVIFYLIKIKTPVNAPLKVPEAKLIVKDNREDTPLKIQDLFHINFEEAESGEHQLSIKEFNLFDQLKVVTWENSPGAKNLIFSGKYTKRQLSEVSKMVTALSEFYGKDSHGNSYFNSDDTDSLLGKNGHPDLINWWIGRMWTDTDINQPKGLPSVLINRDDNELGLTLFFSQSKEDHANNKSKDLYLFFDTETTGLPEDWDASASEVENWPRMVQLACLICNSDGKIIKEQNYIIKPEGYSIPVEATNIHGISTNKANTEGTDLDVVLGEFENLILESTHLVAHNMEFDEKIVGAEYHRKLGKDPLESMRQKICTMKSQAVIDYCELPPFRYGSYKYPKLSELHTKLFGSDFDSAHNAMNDIKATMKCFFELKRKKII